MAMSARLSNCPKSCSDQVRKLSNTMNELAKYKGHHFMSGIVTSHGCAIGLLRIPVFILNIGVGKGSPKRL